MDLFEKTAYLLDDDSIIITEGVLKKDYCKSPNYTGAFYDQLEKPATQILKLQKPGKNEKRQNTGEVIRVQAKLLHNIIDKESNRSTIYANKYNSDLFIVNTMALIDMVVNDLIDGSDTDYTYCIKWTDLIKFIKDRADQISRTNNIANVFNVYAKIVEKEVAAYKSTQAYQDDARRESRRHVKEILEDGAVQEQISTLSNGRFEILLSPVSDVRPPIIIDHQKQLILNFRNYETLEGVLVASNGQELYNTIKNQFDGQTGIFNGITKTTIPEGIEFEYHDDVLVACDWSMFNLVTNRRNERGTYKLNADPNIVVVLGNNGESLRSGFDVGEEESRYINWFDKNNNEFGVRLNRNDKFNGMYTNKNYTFYVFEIKKTGKSQTYISRGTYKIDDTQTNATQVVYNRISTDMARLTSTPAPVQNKTTSTSKTVAPAAPASNSSRFVNDNGRVSFHRDINNKYHESLTVAQRAEMLDEAITKLEAAGYTVIKE